MATLAGNAPAWAQARQTRRPTTPRAVVAHYPGDPPVGAVVRAALQASSLDPASLERLATRARLRGWVPTLRLGARRGQSTDRSASQTVDLDRTHLSTDEALSIQATLTFRLDRLVYAPEHAALRREARRQELERQDLAGTVVRLYFKRRKLQRRRDREGTLSEDDALRLAELTALLDAFTAGAFTRMMSGTWNKRNARTGDFPSSSPLK